MDALDEGCYLSSTVEPVLLSYGGLEIMIDPLCCFVIEQVYKSVDSYKGELKVAVDIGAHVGVFTMFAAQRGAHVHAFEPCAENSVMFMRNMEHNKDSLLGKIFFYQLAVTEKTGDILELKGGKNTGQRSLLYNDDYIVVNKCRTVSLKQVISDVMTHYGRIDYLKMDVEGYEWKLIDTADEELKRMIGRISRVDISEHPLNDEHHFTRGPDLDYGSKMNDFLLGCGLKQSSIGHG